MFFQPTYWIFICKMSNRVAACVSSQICNQFEAKYELRYHIGIFANTNKHQSHICSPLSSKYFLIQIENKSLSPRLKQLYASTCNVHFAGVGDLAPKMMNVRWFHDSSKGHVINIWADVAFVKRYEGLLRIFVKETFYRFRTLCPKNRLRPHDIVPLASDGRQ